MGTPLKFEWRPSEHLFCSIGSVRSNRHFYPLAMRRVSAYVELWTLIQHRRARINASKWSHFTFLLSMGDISIPTRNNRNIRMKNKTKIAAHGRCYGVAKGAAVRAIWIGDLNLAAGHCNVCVCVYVCMCMRACVQLRWLICQEIHTKMLRAISTHRNGIRIICTCSHIHACPYGRTSPTPMHWQARKRAADRQTVAAMCMCVRRMPTVEYSVTGIGVRPSRYFVRVYFHSSE